MNAGRSLCASDHKLNTLSPTTGHPATLRLAVISGTERQEHEISREVVLGRRGPATSRRPDISIAGDEAVSRRHLRIWPRRGVLR